MLKRFKAWLENFWLILKKFNDSLLTPEINFYTNDGYKGLDRKILTPESEKEKLESQLFREQFLENKL